MNFRQFITEMKLQKPVLTPDDISVDNIPGFPDGVVVQIPVDIFVAFTSGNTFLAVPGLVICDSPGQRLFVAWIADGPDAYYACQLSRKDSNDLSNIILNSEEPDA